jgi:hypothetical protein
MKKVIGLLVCLTMFAAMFAGCSNSGATEETASATVSEQASASESLGTNPEVSGDGSKIGISVLTMA